MHQLIFAIRLSKYALASRHAHIVAFFIGAALLRTYIAQRRIKSQGQAANHFVDLANGREFAQGIDFRTFIDGLEASGKSADFCDVVIFFDMFAGAGDGKGVQQFEIVQIHHFHKSLGRTFLLRQFRPFIKHQLRLAQGKFYAGDACLLQGIVSSLGDEGNLILDVVHSIVHGGSGEHQHLCPHSCFDNILHESLISSLAVVVRDVVAEIVTLIDNDEIIIFPVERGKIDRPGHSLVAAKVGVIQYIVVKAIGDEDIALVVLGINRPVFPKLLWCKDEHPVIPQFVVFDNGQSREGLA